MTASQAIPPIIPCSIIQIRAAASQANKWLLINIQNAQEFCCQVLNRDVWSSSKVKAIVRSHFLFWQVCLRLYDTRQKHCLFPVHSSGLELCVNQNQRASYSIHIKNKYYFVHVINVGCRSVDHLGRYPEM